MALAPPERSSRQAFGSISGQKQASSGAGRLDAYGVGRQDGCSQSGTSEAMTLTVVPSIQVLSPQLEIAGGRRLSGELRVSGAKNSALVLMTASLLTADALRLRNVPPLTDILGMGDILGSLGVGVQRSADSLVLDGSGLNQSSPPYELVNSLRASFFCIGPLLARLGIAQVPLPGGCQIGTRPVVEHVKGLKVAGSISIAPAWAPPRP